MNLSFGKKVVYALGQFGLVLSAFGAGSLFVTFFVTRSFSDTVLFPAFLHQGYFFGFFTAAGLILALSKLVEAAGGLVFGYASDRNTMKKGRRTGFMLAAALPVSLLSVMVFFPPSGNALLFNSLYVLVITVLFYFFLSMYTAPYLALLSELGSSPRDRMFLSTLQAAATALASLLGNRIFFFMELVESRYALQPLGSFRMIIVLFALVSGLCMMLPVLLIDEKALCRAEPVKETMAVSVSTVLKDSYFRPFLLADLMYRIASAFIMTGFMYYITVLLGLSQRAASFFMLLVFFANLLLFFPVCMLTRFLGKRKMLLSAFLLFMAVLAVAVFAGKYSIPPTTQGVILSVLLAIPISVFTVVPNALVADLAVAAERRTGLQRGGMYFGLWSLTAKAGHLFSSLLCPLVMSVGVQAAGAAGRTGLRITMVVAAFFALAGFLFLFAYREKEITVLLEKKN